MKFYLNRISHVKISSHHRYNCELGVCNTISISANNDGKNEIKLEFWCDEINLFQFIDDCAMFWFYVDDQYKINANAEWCVDKIKFFFGDFIYFNKTSICKILYEIPQIIIGAEKKIILRKIFYKYRITLSKIFFHLFSFKKFSLIFYCMTVFHTVFCIFFWVF